MQSSPEAQPRKAAFFDIDGTLTKDRTWEGITSYFQERGIRRGTHLVFLMVHYPLYFARQLRLISEATFRGRWAADLGWYVRGYTLQQGVEVWDWAVGEFLHWREDIRAVLEQHHAEGDPVVLVSSAPLPLVQRVATKLGVEHAVGTHLETRAGRYTGRSLEPVCIDAFKASMAQEHLRELGLDIDYKASSAYADSITDIPLLEMTGSPVAVYPDEKLRPIAEGRGWRIIS